MTAVTNRILELYSLLTKLLRLIVTDTCEITIWKNMNVRDLLIYILAKYAVVSFQLEF